MKHINSILRSYLKSDVSRRMAKGTFWTFTGTASAKFIVLIAGIICARILGKESYGELGIIRSTIITFLSVGIAGLGLTATKFISEYKQDQSHRIPSIYIITTRFSVILGTLISGLIIVFAQDIATTIDNPSLSDDLRWGGVLLFLGILNGIQNDVLSGFEDFKSIAINSLYGSISESILMCIGAYYGGVKGAIIGYGTGYIVIYLFNRQSVIRNLKRHNLSIALSKFDKNDLSIIYKFSLPAALSSILSAPVFWIIKTLLIRHDGYGQMAIYEAADQWRIIILFIPTAISNVVLPILSSMVNHSNHDFWKVLRINILLNAGISLFLTLGICLFSRQIMEFYGKDFGDGMTLIILCVSSIFTSISNVVGLSISSRNKMWHGFVFNVTWGVMLIVLTHIYLQMNYGATSVAIAMLISNFAITLIQIIYLRRVIK